MKARNTKLSNKARRNFVHIKTNQTNIFTETWTNMTQTNPVDIFDALCDMVSFVKFKICNKHPGRSVICSKI